MDILEEFSKEGVYTILRLDPIIYGFTSDLDEINELIEWASGIGVKHVMSSTGRFKEAELTCLKLEFAEDHVTTYATYLDSDVTAGTEYWYRIVTSDGCGSTVVNITPPAGRTRR